MASSTPAPAWVNVSDGDKVIYMLQSMDELREQTNNHQNDIGDVEHNNKTYTDSLEAKLTTNQTKIDADVAGLATNVNNLVGMLAILQTTITRIEAQINTSMGGSGAAQILAPSSAAQPQPTAPAPSSGLTAKVKMAAPQKFDGTKQEDAISFRIACARYINTNMSGHSADQVVAFITSYLEGSAAEWVNSYEEFEILNPGTAIPWLHDANLFWQEFTTRYGDLNRTENNRNKWQKLKQSKTVQDYLTLFNLYSTGLNYNDAAMRDQFYDGLSSDVTDSMVAQNYDPRTKTFAQLTQWALEIDCHLISFGNKRTSHGGNKSSSNNALTSRPTNNPQNAPQKEKFK